VVRIVIPAFRSLRTLRECVDAVLTARNELLQTCAQIVVVDDGGNDGIEAVLADYPIELRSTGGSASAAVARNTGVSDFQSGVIVFIDADVVIAPSTLRQLVDPILSGESEAVVGNYSQDVSGLSFAAKYKQLYISLIYDRRRGSIENDYWTAVGSIDARCFHNLGGFDCTFPGACGEDGEFGLRLTRAGRRILGVPEAVGAHRHRMTIRSLIANDWRKGHVALQNQFNSHGRLRDNKHATPRDVLAAAAAASILASTVLVARLGTFPTLICMATYVSARADVLERFGRHGVWFAFRAAWLMLVLDILRCACVISNFRLLKFSKFSRQAIRESTHV